MISSQCLHYISSKFIASDPYTLVTYDTRQCNHRNSRSSSTDIDDHIADRLLNIDPNTKGCCHRFMKKVNFLCASLLRTITHGTLLNLRNTAGNANHHSPTWGKQRLFGIDHLDHLPYH